MSIGIGLGGFMDGFQRGQQIRDNREDRLQQKELLAKRMARQDTLDARADAEYDRGEAQRQSIADINTSAQTEFDNRVKAGTEQPDNFDTFWSSYALPKLKTTYLSNGDLEKAKKVQEWGDSADAKAGAKLSMSALFKAQNGDIDGAFDDAMKAGRMNGYISHGMEILGHDPLVSPDGKPLGYRLRFKTAEGKEQVQDIETKDVTRLIATYLNPEAAWQSQVAASSAAQKKASELDEYEAKKKIDKRYGTGDAKGRGDAITALRKRMPPRDETSPEDAPKGFDELSRDEQEKLIGGELELQQGQPGLGGAPAPAAAAPQGLQQKVIYNNNTGQISQPVPRSPQPAAAPQQSAPATRDDNVAYLLQSAEQAMQQGVPAQRVAQELLQNGIPQEQWPDALKAAVAQQAQQNQIGLSR